MWKLVQFDRFAWSYDAYPAFACHDEPAHASRSCSFCFRYKEDQQRDSQEAAEKAKLASMTDEERRRWELANPKVHLPYSRGTLKTLCWLQKHMYLAGHAKLFTLMSSHHAPPLNAFVCWAKVQELIPPAATKQSHHTHDAWQTTLAYIEMEPKSSLSRESITHAWHYELSTLLAV